jgi:hypothetical protein
MRHSLFSVLLGIVMMPAVSGFSISGSWFDPAQNGQGMFIEALGGGRIQAYWFSYDFQDRQRWFVGLGQRDGNMVRIDTITTRGGQFGLDHDPVRVQRISWGAIEITFQTCNRAWVSYESSIGFGSGSFEMRRLTFVDGLDCGDAAPVGVFSSRGVIDGAISGSWFNPALDGQGFAVEAIGNGLLQAYAFTYDEGGGQRWLAGLGRITGASAALDTLTTEGGRFATPVVVAPVRRIPWGTITFTFVSCNSGEVILDGVHGKFAIPVTRLTQLERRVCQSPSTEMYGLADPGMHAGRVKTPYPSVDTGTTAEPLTILRPYPTDEGCLFNTRSADLVGGILCQSQPIVYGDSSHAWWQNGDGQAQEPWWVVGINNEPSFDPCNPGPPDLSLPLQEPGEGLAGFAMEASRSEDGRAAHLALDLSYENPCGWRAIPFLSVGARDDRGNEVPVGALNPQPATVPHRLRFNVEVEQFREPKYPDGRDGAAFIVQWTLSEWGGVPRMLYLILTHWNREIEGNGALGRVWNWPAAEHYLYPGADIAYLEAEDINELCGISTPNVPAVAGASVDYDLDLQQLFRCASGLNLFRNPMPSQQRQRNLRIRGVHWAIEAQGSDGLIWISLHRPQMLGAAGPQQLTRGKVHSEKSLRCPSSEYVCP